MLNNLKNSFLEFSSLGNFQLLLYKAKYLLFIFINIVIYKYTLVLVQI